MKNNEHALQRSRNVVTVSGTITVLPKERSNVSGTVSVTPNLLVPITTLNHRVTAIAPPQRCITTNFNNKPFCAARNSLTQIAFKVSSLH